MKTICEVDKKIHAIYLSSTASYFIGCKTIEGAVTAIIPYREEGYGGYVPWFVIMVGESEHIRVNSAHVIEIVYEAKDE